MIVSTNSILIPGVFILEWPIYFILLLYWLESVFIGVLNVLKIFITGFYKSAGNSWLFHIFSLPLVVFIACFFCIHYGGFLFGHFVFLNVLISQYFTGKEFSIGVRILENLSNLIIQPELITHFTISNFLDSELFSIVCLFISNILIFLIYFIGEGKYRSGDYLDYMMRPYPRIIIMHITILLGAFLFIYFGKDNPTYYKLSILLFWILAKTIVDIKMTLKEEAA